MGSNNSTEKVTLEEKLQHMENKISKRCQFHQQEVVVFCSLPNCKKSPYLCNQCINSNVHSHEEGLYRHDEFIKSMVNLIELKKIEDNKILSSSVSPGQHDHANTIKQQMKLMQHAERILNQTTIQLNQFKRRLQSSIDRTMRKVNKLPKSKADSYYRFYSNPNVLVNKLINDENQIFIKELKSKIDLGTSHKKGYSQQQQLVQLRAQFDSIKSNLREILSTNTAGGGNFIKKTNSTSGQLLDPKANYRKSVTLNDPPLKVFAGGFDILTSTKRQLYKIQPFERTKLLIHNQNVSKLVSEPDTGQFIAMINPNTVLYWDNKKMQRISFITKIAGISVLKSKKMVYGLIGEEEGVFNVIHLRENKSVYHYRCFDRPLSHIQICYPNQMIYCATQSANIYMFKFQNKFDEFQFDYIGQISSSVLPAGQLQLMRIYNQDLYLMGPFRNVVLYSLMLGTQIIRTQYNKKAPPFTDAVIYGGTGYNTQKKGEQFLITLCDNQSVLYCWSFDREKRAIKVDPIILTNRQNKLEQLPILSLTKYKHEIWVAKDSLKEVQAFSLQF